MIPLLNGRIKRVHIEMKYDAEHGEKENSEVRIQKPELPVRCEVISFYFLVGRCCVAASDIPQTIV
jgi:hypothetical protein